jgi:putative tryptophan/tyrosine transport system substrate-binding protein
MRRREFVRLLSSTVVARPLTARAQQVALPVVGFLHSGTADTFESEANSFRGGLKETKYTENQNVEVEYRWGNNKVDRLPALAADLVGRHVAVIVAGGPPAVLAARTATSTIPIVAAFGSDPVKLGLAKSLNRPGGNVTGATAVTTELVSKRVGLLCEVIPQETTVAYLNPGPRQSFPATAQMTSDFLTATKALHRKIVILEVDDERDFEAAFQSLIRQGAGALVIASSVFFDTYDKTLASLAFQHAIPAIYQRRDFVQAGGMMSYSPKWDDVFRAAGRYAGQILKGAKPAELPFQESNSFELAINLKTAKTLGLTVPPGILSIADEVIE